MKLLVPEVVEPNVVRAVAEPIRQFPFRVRLSS